MGFDGGDIEPQPLRLLYNSGRRQQPPSLEREDILAALDYAAHQTDHVVLPAS